MQEMTGKVLRIEKTSIHDGEGLRTVVFLMGCPLRCAWCSTPESQLRYQTQAEACGYGKEMSVSQVVKEVCKDSVFFFHSGGGVTISGGEVLLQSAFAKEILKECMMDGMQTAIETSLFADYEKDIAPLLPYLSAMYVDFKLCDEEMHRKYTGVFNERIKKNLLRLNEEYDRPIHIRIPTIPGVNMTRENMVKTAAFLRSLKNVKDIELLPYHKLGSDTYRKLQVTYELPDVESPSFDSLKEMAEVLVRECPGKQIKIKGEPVDPVSLTE